LRCCTATLHKPSSPAIVFFGGAARGMDYLPTPANFVPYLDRPLYAVGHLTSSGAPRDLWTPGRSLNFNRHGWHHRSAPEVVPHPGTYAASMPLVPPGDLTERWVRLLRVVVGRRCKPLASAAKGLQNRRRRLRSFQPALAHKLVRSRRAVPPFPVFSD